MISVVMGVYNAAETLRETLDSILAQEEVELEVIVVDDGSTDATPAILAGYPIQVIRQENRGLTHALIAGCAAARGSLIARHDAGDLSHPRRLAVQQRLFDDPDVVFVSCATQYVGPELEPLWVARPSVVAPASIVDLTRRHGLVDGPTHHGSAVFRRDAYERAGGYRAAFYYGQDYDLWYRLAELGKFCGAAEVLYTARITPGSISSAAKREQETLARLSRAALELRQRGRAEDALLAAAASVRPVRAAASRRRRAAGLYFIGEALRRNGDPRARRYLREALAAWPLSARTWIRFLQAR
ncbi:MAG TPA: glycosyltransferase [Thermoanaerobaculia bacterium]|nr:glycosyltransferase [Thermoanaerobaculia bacterium]